MNEGQKKQAVDAVVTCLKCGQPVVLWTTDGVRLHIMEHHK